jgi:hypothetical protein
MALAMMTGYVVYSQRDQARSFAPGSKSDILSGANPSASLAAVPSTNQVEAPSSAVFAPGSKSIAPLIHVPPPASVQPIEAGQRRLKIAPGSKSAAVFDFQQQQTLAQSVFARGLELARSTNLTAELKP